MLTEDIYVCTSDPPGRFSGFDPSLEPPSLLLQPRKPLTMRSLYKQLYNGYTPTCRIWRTRSTSWRRKSEERESAEAFRSRVAIEAARALHTACTEQRSMKLRDLTRGISPRTFDARTRNLGQFPYMSECIEHVCLMHSRTAAIAKAPPCSHWPFQALQRLLEE